MTEMQQTPETSAEQLQSTAADELPTGAAPDVAPPAVSAATQVAAAPKNALTPLVKVSIGALLAAGAIGVALVLINPVAEVGARATATFLLFAFFVSTTLLSARLQRFPAWFTPLSVSVSSFVLAAGLVHTWAVGLVYEPYHYEEYLYYNYAYDIYSYLLMMLIVMCIAFWVAVLILWFAGLAKQSPQHHLAFKAALAAAALLLLSAGLTVIGEQFKAFGYTPHDLYWRVVISCLVLSAMFFAITVILVFVLRGSVRDSRAAVATAGGGSPLHAAAPVAAAPVAAAPVAAETVAPVAAAPVTAPPAVQVAPVTATALQTTAFDEVNAQTVATPAAPAAQALLPWPTFADGTPLPALPDGQPDFSVPGAPYPPHLLRENQQ